jgi:hypothetical protein
MAWLRERWSALLTVTVAGIVLGLSIGVMPGCLTPQPGPPPEPPRIELPAKHEAQPGRLTRLQAKANGVVRWHVVGDLDLIPLPDDWVALSTPHVGVYQVFAWTAKGNVPSEAAVCVVTVVAPTPPVPPKPPVPPVPPTPPVPPVPPEPDPKPAKGERVLIVYETADLSRLPAGQQLILYSQATRNYLDAHCAADGPTKAWRIWDKDVDTLHESAKWQELMKRPYKSLPWVIISNGGVVHEGPLPATVDEALTLFKKHLEK